MNKKIKLAISRLFVVCFVAFAVFVTNNDVMASSDTATIKNIKVKNLDYVSDSHKKDLSNPTCKYEIHGSAYSYGYVSLWSSIYKFYNETEDRMIYYVFVESHIEGNKKTSKGYYHARKMKVEISADYIGSAVSAYAPTETQHNISQTSGQSSNITFGIEANSEGLVTLSSTASYGFSASETVSMSDVSLYTTSTQGLNKSSQIFEYDFVKYKKKGDSERSPYIGDYLSLSTAVFEYDNYSVSNKLVNFNISYSGRIFRYSLTKSSNYTMERTILHSYSIYNDVVNYSCKSDKAIDV